jgi:hypothetical protein
MMPLDADVTQRATLLAATAVITDVHSVNVLEDGAVFDRTHTSKLAQPHRLEHTHRAVIEFIVHYHSERSASGKGMSCYSPQRSRPIAGAVRWCTERLGGLLKYYASAA